MQAYEQQDKKNTAFSMLIEHYRKAQISTPKISSAPPQVRLRFRSFSRRALLEHRSTPSDVTLKPRNMMLHLCGSVQVEEGGSAGRVWVVKVSGVPVVELQQRTPNPPAATAMNESAALGCAAEGLAVAASEGHHD